MIIKGFDKFREKIPSLNGIKIIIIPIYLTLVIISIIGFLEQFNSYSEVDFQTKKSIFGGNANLYGGMLSGMGGVRGMPPGMM